MMRSAWMACAPGVVLVLLVLSAGCDYVPNRDVVVVKLSPDGSTEWIKVLDAGFDDDARAIAELADGSLVVGGQSSRRTNADYYSRLVLLTPQGGMVWSRGFEDPFWGGITTLVPLPGEGIVAATLDGNVFMVDQNGTAVWAGTAVIGDVWSACPAPDGGVLISGRKQDTIPFGSGVDYGPDGNITVREARPEEHIPTPGCTVTMLTGGKEPIPIEECTGPVMSVFQASLVKLDRDGNPAWQRSYGAYGMQSAWSVLATANGTYLISAYGLADPYHAMSSENVLYAALLDGNGSVIWTTELERTDYYIPAVLSEIPGGYRMIIPERVEHNDGSIGLQAKVTDLDRDGTITGTLLLATGTATIPTRDGGYISIGFPLRGGESGYSEDIYGDATGNFLHARKFHGDGTLEWDRDIPGVTANYVRNIIETSDGGYAVLAVKENR
jgi:hypothetical protein